MDGDVSRWVSQRVPKSSAELLLPCAGAVFLLRLDRRFEGFEETAGAFGSSVACDEGLPIDQLMALSM